MSNTNWNPKVDGAVHVFPMNDSRKHKASPDCECKPTVMVVGPTTMYTHNPFVDLPQFGIDHRDGIEEFIPVTTKKKVSETSQPEVQTFSSEHWTIKYRGGFNDIMRLTKTFYIPDAELDELAQLIEKWKEREK